MSCSTTSLLAGTKTTNTLTIEDPYVFTETVPTTPPLLFSNSQKSRNRLEAKPQQNKTNSATTLKTINQTTIANKESAYVKVKNYGTQTQTSAPLPTSIQNKIITTTQTIVNPPTAVLGVLNTNNIKYEPKSTKLQEPQSQQRQQKYAQNIFAAQNENIIATQTQQQQQPQQQHQQPQQKLLSTTPPPLLLSHTPSLWQTPLLLENAAAATTTVANSISNIPKETPVRLAFKTPQPPTPSLSATALITPPTIAVPIMSNMPTLSTLTENVISNASPLHLLMPSAAPLPPSNFHHTTLAQHLQKLQCLKKSKKPNLLIASTAPTITASQTEVNKTPQKPQHSSNDLNEIPVNVIYRSPTSSDSNKEAACNTTDSSAAKCETKSKESYNNKQQLANSSVFNYSKLTKTQKCININKQGVFSENQLQKEKRKVKSIINSKASSNTSQSQIVLTNQSSTHPANVTKLKKINPKQRTKVCMQKRYRKTNVFPTLLNERDRVALAFVPDISLSTKAVAVIKRPYKEHDNDLTLLSDENELPFCVQKHWFTTHQDPTLSGALGREGRIAEYKSVLHRQAMQLLATRSLQILPFYAARKRLLCVDRLLRKYRDHNKTVRNGSSRKKCEIEMCKNPALAMTTFCQQHMIRNSKQGLFVLCSAKNIKDNDNQHCPCDIPVLNIQKHYTPPLCYLHSGHHQRNVAVNKNSCDLQMSAKQSNNSNKNLNITKSSSINHKRKLTSAIACVNNTTETNLTKIEDVPQLIKRTHMQRKNSTTSLESIASNSHSSFGSSIQTATVATLTEPSSQMLKNTLNATNMLSPPALAPLSYNNSNNIITTSQTSTAHRQNVKFSSSGGTIDPFAEQEINKLVAQFAMAAAAATSVPTNKNGCINNSNKNNTNNNKNFNSFNFMNTNSNSNLTSSGVGSLSSLPSTDELLTQEMLSNCENSSAYASSSEDTGLGELSESELIAVSKIADNIDANDAIVSSFSNVNSIANGIIGVGGSGFNVDDVIPDEIPLGDERLLEENDLVNVFDALPVNLNELFNTVVRQDEREEIERALEIADKHLKTLQQTIGSDTDFLADFLDVNDDMLADTEIDSSVLPPNDNLEAAALYLENADSLLSGSVENQNQLTAASSLTMPANCVDNSTSNAGVMDIRGLLQTRTVTILDIGLK